MYNYLVVFCLVVVATCTSEGAPSLSDILKSIYDENPTYDPSQAVSAFVVNSTDILFQGHAGIAKKTGRVPMTPETRFIINSISKTISSVTALKAFHEYLHPKGYTLHSDLLDTLPFKIDAPGITSVSLYQLLHHTSGIVDNWAILNKLYTHGHDSPISLKQYAEGYLQHGGKYYSKNNFGKPDTFSYSSATYGILGYMVERWTGKDFKEYCQEKILSPLGISPSGTTLGGGWKLSSIPKHTPTAVPNGTEPLFGYPDYPSGLFVGTGKAIAVIAQAFLNKMVTLEGKPLIDRHLAEKMVEIDSLGATTAHTMGFFIKSSPWWGDRLLLGHDGMDTGLSGELYWVPSERCPYSVVVLTNHAWPKNRDDPGLPNRLAKVLFNYFTPIASDNPKECYFGGQPEQSPPEENPRSR